METLHFSITIDAPIEHVWNIMLGEKTYREWTSVFMQGSHYVGDWNEGNKILFLGPGENGELSGMVSRIKENRKHEFVSIKHLGFVQDGKEDTSSEAAKSWAGALENYTFIDKNGHTKLSVEMNTTEEYKQMFMDTWPKALEKIRDISEKQA